MTSNDLKALEAEMQGIAGPDKPGDAAQNPKPEPQTFEPGGDEIGGEAYQADDSELYAGLWGIIGMALGAKLGKHWEFTETEMLMLGKSTSDLANKYWPETSIGPEYAFIGALAGAIYPKYITHQKLQGETVEGEFSKTPEKEPENDAD